MFENINSKTIGCMLTLGVTVSFLGCSKLAPIMPQKLGTITNQQMEAVVVPPDFNWKMTQDIMVKIKIPAPIGTARIQLTDADNKHNFSSTGFSDSAGQFEKIITIPSSITTIKATLLIDDKAPQSILISVDGKEINAQF